MQVIDQLTTEELLSYESFAEETTKRTNHLAERNDRIKTYKDMGLLDPTFVDGFEVDKGHKHGPEAHLLNPNGIIYIFNSSTKRFITVLGARPGQIRRYFRSLGLNIPNEIEDIIDIAYENTVYNNINEV